MALSFDSSADLGTSSSVSSKTVAYTVGSGSNRYLLVYVTADTTSDLVTGVTYAGVSMTQFAKKQGTAALHWAYLFGLPNPASGANNVVISASGSCNSLGGIAASYANVRGPSEPDASNTGGNSGVTSLAVNVTSVADNCWGVYGINTATSAITGYTNVTQRRQGTTSDNSFVYALADTNGVIHPAGSFTATANNAGVSSDWGGILVTLVPYSFTTRAATGVRAGTRQIRNITT